MNLGSGSAYCSQLPHGLGVLVLAGVFRSDLKAIMSRIATIKFPGGEL